MARDETRSPPPGCPMHLPADGEPTAYSATDLSYNDYLKVPELLDLQHPQSEPKHHDEMLFIIIHQAYELWFKLVIHEITDALAFLGEGEVLRAHHRLKRVVEIFKLLVPQIHILETMTPVDFLQFRDRLKPASGFQSLQFREVEFMAGLKDEKYLKHFANRPEVVQALRERLSGPDLRSSYYTALAKLGLAMPADAALREDAKEPGIAHAIMQAILPIYQDPHHNLPLYLLSEALVEFDEYLSLWREHHVRVVERIIGFKTGTGGSSGSEYLRSTTSKKCFPLIWETRTHLEVKV